MVVDKSSLVMQFSWKFQTPSETHLTISSFDSSKAMSNLGLQMNFVFEDRRCLKGAIINVFVNAKLNCLAAPNQLRTPVMSLGAGKALMLFRYFTDGATL